MGEDQDVPMSLPGKGLATDILGNPSKGSYLLSRKESNHGESETKEKVLLQSHSGAQPGNGGAQAWSRQSGGGVLGTSVGRWEDHTCERGMVGSRLLSCLNLVAIGLMGLELTPASPSLELETSRATARAFWLLVCPCHSHPAAVE